MVDSQAVLLVGSHGEQFALALSRVLRWPLQRVERRIFSEGNVSVRLPGAVAGKQVILVQGLWGQGRVGDDLLELLFTVDACRCDGAASVTVVCPFFSYGKSDKRDGAGTSVRSHVCARLFEAVGVNLFITLDWHSEAVGAGFGFPAVNLSARRLLLDRLQTFGLKRPLIVAPDAGYRQRAAWYAQQLATELVVCHKSRPHDDEKPVVTAIDGEVTGRAVVIVDDFTTSGGTLAAVAQALVARGAREVYAVVTHVPLTPEAQQKLVYSPIAKIITTNTTTPEDDLDGRLEVVDASRVVADYLRGV